MNTLTTNTEAMPTTSDDLCKIAIAFAFPREHPGVSVLGLENPTLLMALVLGLRWALEREQLIDGDVFGAHGDTCDGAIRFETRKREEALKVVREWRDRNPITGGGTSVAWWCEAEGAWRIVARGLIEIDFDGFLTPERSQARSDITERIQKAISEMPKDVPPDAPQQ